MRIFIAILLSILTACGSPPKVPVTSRDTISVREQTEKIGGEYVTYVRAGDTLYSIAFGAGLSPVDVAAWNGISQDNVLFSGQKLRLTKPLNFKEKPRVSPVDAVVISVPKVINKPPQTVTKPKTAQTNKPSGNYGSTSLGSANLRWQWPTKGKISSSFSLKRGNKGIDIRGKRGQDIVASAAGKVVYAGNGLRGYGNLLIIKHNEQFLSAYAHNDNMLVREGQYVKQGQKVSVMGVAKNGEPVLHFEIRLQGQPVNPVKYLSK